MKKKIILIAGYLAAGKSTFALQAARAVHVPCFVKDSFKSALCQNVSIASRAESSLFSAVTFDAMMYVMERIFETGGPVLLEGNFVPSGVKKVDEAGVIRQLIGEYGYTPLTFQFTGDTRVLYERFVEREKTVERGRANKIGAGVPFALFDQWCHNFDGFCVGGEIVPVDTTDFAKVDFDAYLAIARAFMYDAKTESGSTSFPPDATL